MPSNAFAQWMFLLLVVAYAFALCKFWPERFTALCDDLRRFLQSRERPPSQVFIQPDVVDNVDYPRPAPEPSPSAYVLADVLPLPMSADVRLPISASPYPPTSYLFPCPPTSYLSPRPPTSHVSPSPLTSYLPPYACRLFDNSPHYARQRSNQLVSPTLSRTCR
jgi:hypothetical protein